MGKKCFIFFSVFLSFQSCLYTQISEITFEHYKTDHGLSASLVRSVIQDKAGYLWFGTYNGLDRYDGSSFKSYKNIPGDTLSITNGFVQCLLEDKSGNLWIGTTNGFDKFNKTTQTFIHYKPHKNINPLEWNKNNILSIIQDRDGFIWIGTGDGLNKFDPLKETFTHFRNNLSDTTSLRHNVVFALMEDSYGDIWIGTGNGLDVFNRETESFIHYWHDSIQREGFYKDLIKSKTWITALYEDSDGIIWIGTQGGLLELNRNTNKFILYEYDPGDPETISFYGVTSIFQENQDALWIGTWNGLNYFNKKSKKFTRFYHESKNLNSLSNNSVASVFRERSGTLWITTYGGGVNKVNRTTYPFKNYSEQKWKDIKRFSSASIMDISNARDGTLWIATPQGLVNFNPTTEKFQDYGIKKNVRIVYEDGKNNLWVSFNSSSGRGLTKIDKSGRLINVIDSLGNSFPYLVNGIVEYDDSTLWLCTEDIGAIVKVNTLSNTFLIAAEIVTTLNVIHKDDNGLLWIGTREAGLFCYDPHTNKIVDHFIADSKDSNSLSGNTILTIYETKDSTIWLGTNIGLNKFDKKKKNFNYFTEIHGLPHNWAYQVFEDAKGDLWINTLKGISRFNPSSNTFKNYDILSGIISTDRSGVGCKTANNEIYLVSPAGLIRFYPDSVIDNPYIPPIVITNVSVSGNTMLFFEELSLAHDNNNLSFEFAALSYVKPEKNLYAYKLEGVDEDWIFAGNYRYASYINLDPGEYIFHVKGSNNDGVWNEMGTSVKIIINPPFWATWWAYTFYIILFFSILKIIRSYEMNRLNWKNQVMLDEVKLKEKEETERMKSHIFANISHEFRTPLTLIQGPVEKMLTEEQREEIKNNYQMILQNTSRLLTLVNQLLDLSKIESGKINLHTTVLDVAEVVRSSAWSFETLADQKRINFSVAAPEKEIIGAFDRDCIEKILINLLSNAFKFTSPGGYVNVTLTSSGSFAEITVTDTGIGIPTDELDKIFNRFYQVETSQSTEQEGTGIGLAHTKELVELHKGVISVASEIGMGSSFIVRLPLQNALSHGDHLTNSDGQKIKSREIFSEPEEVAKENETDEAFNEIRPVVLIIEDNPDMRKYIRMHLDDKYAVTEAANGIEGISIAVDMIPDIVISDVMMPKVNGYEVCRQLKQDEKTSHIPVILLTAKASIESKIEGLETGADSYLTKPFNSKELLIRVNNLIEQRKKLREKFSGAEFLKPGILALPSIDKSFLNKVKELIENNLSDEKFGVEKLAEEAAMSRSQLHRKLKGIVNRSPGEFILIIRLEHAVEMIRQNTGTISEIAYSSGFNSPNYFAKCFRKKYGCSPTEYRENFSQRVDNL